MTFEKETVLKTLFPEDVLSIAKGLTDGEVEFLQQVDSLLEISTVKILINIG
ncbi:glutaryl-CoA dehydrogenase [Staphylococcus aureus]|nr:glutaryl-CoA dehydrogenase [Staphylococcus aureus]